MLLFSSLIFIKNLSLILSVEVSEFESKEVEHAISKDVAILEISIFI